MKPHWNGARFRELRLSKGCSLEAVAVKTHRSAGTVARWERNDAIPPTGLRAVIAEALGVTVDDLG